MNKEKLKQIKYIKSEISVIEEQIENIEPAMAIDKVNGSSRVFPYTQRSFTLKGIDYEDYERRTQRLRNKLIKRKNDLLIVQEEVNSFIEKVEDSLIRQAIELRYVEGLSWSEVAVKTGNNITTPDSIRMAVNRYLNE